jgi:hypothetical protein
LLVPAANGPIANDGGEAAFITISPRFSDGRPAMPDREPRKQPIPLTSVIAEKAAK